MIAKIINLGCLKFLLLFCIISKTQASSFYDLREGITREFAGSELESLSFTKHAVMASEHFEFSKQFLDQTRNMMERESVFRHNCTISGDANIAQLCIYGTYKNTIDWKFVEIFDIKSCKGQFYLSGNDPVSLPASQKANASSTINIQKIAQGKGYIEVRQRPQPLLATISDTVNFLEKIGDFIKNPTPEALELAKQASAKKREVNALIDKRDNIIRELEQQAHQIETVGAAPDTLIHGFHKFTAGILRELIACLRVGDFSFNEMKDARNNTNLKQYISFIQKGLSERNLSELLNSKHFNLGCSEPLLLVDLLHNNLNKVILIREINKILLSDPLDAIVVQLHSTKTPCISCLIGCCGHHQYGVIKSFFNDTRNAVKNALKREDVSVFFLISYHAPYEDRYPFYIPVVSDFSFRSDDAVLLVNMNLYDERVRKMKERILKEERLRIESFLSRKLEEKKGIPLTPEDIKGIWEIQ